MQESGAVLVIGPPALEQALGDALPRAALTAVEHALPGLWLAGRRTFDAIVLAAPDTARTASIVRNLRTLANQARLVLVMPSAREPEARVGLEAGADEYVLEPLRRTDLETALRIRTVPPPAPPAPALPVLEQFVAFGEVLGHLADGPQAVLDKLAALACELFDAEGAAVRAGDLAATAGEPGPPVLAAPVRRQDVEVGTVTLGARRQGAYATGDAARLAEFGRLVDVLVTQARERARWQELAWRDDLSGLHNRRYFDALLDRLLAAAGPRRQLTVLLFDIDDFKSYNDRYGHDTGDALVREMAALLTHCSREHDVVARYGGDEFAVIFWDAEKPRVPGSHHPTDPLALGERFRDAIARHAFRCLGSAAPGPVTISGGLASFPEHGRTRAELVRAADAALLEAKHTGKNRIVLANGEQQGQKR